MLLDTGQRTRSDSQAKPLAAAGIPVKIDAVHRIAHNKVMVIDGETVITGSFNFTEAAELRNAENVFIVWDRAAAEKYLENWRVHEGHSQGFP